MATKSQKLEDQGVYGVLGNDRRRFDVKLLTEPLVAATAALYVTKGKVNKSSTKASNYPLDDNNKLSSAGRVTYHPWNLSAAHTLVRSCDILEAR